MCSLQFLIVKSVLETLFRISVAAPTALRSTPSIRTNAGVLALGFISGLGIVPVTHGFGVFRQVIGPPPT